MIGPSAKKWDAIHKTVVQLQKLSQEKKSNSIGDAEWEYICNYF